MGKPTLVRVALVTAVLAGASLLRADEPEPPRFRLSATAVGSRSGEVPASSPLAGALPAPGLSAADSKAGTGNPSFVAVPLPNSNPTLGTGLGAVGLLFFRPSKTDTVSPSSTAGLGGIYFDTGSRAVPSVSKRDGIGRRTRRPGSSVRAFLPLSRPSPCR